MPLAPTRTGTLTRVRHDRGDKGIADELALQMLGHVLDDLRLVLGICPATGPQVLVPL